MTSSCVVCVSVGADGAFDAAQGIDEEVAGLAVQTLRSQFEDLPCAGLWHDGPLSSILVLRAQWSGPAAGIITGLHDGLR